MRALLVALSLLAVPPVAAAGVAELNPVAIAGMIDLTSFPNSTGPRREDGLRTFADYGFTEVTVVDGTAELREADGSWMFAVTVLSGDGDRAVICVVDRALGGPSYHTQDPVMFELRDGMLVANGEAVVDPGCPHIGE